MSSQKGIQYRYLENPPKAFWPKLRKLSMFHTVAFTYTFYQYMQIYMNIFEMFPMDENTYMLHCKKCPF